MSEFTVEEQSSEQGAKIKVIGCGGGGGNMINHMISSGLNQVDIIAANTDAQALSISLAPTRIQLGQERTKGLGAGMIPDVGAESAKESYKIIKDTLSGADMVFLATGLGGGTGTGATPILAQAAKEVGALVVAVVTMPFKFEQKQRAECAKKGLEELKKECDAIIVIYNQKLFGFLPKSTSPLEAYAVVDDILTRAVKGMVSVLLDKSYINVDFADVRTVMSYRGLALMGIGAGEGENAMSEAIAEAVDSPLFDGMSLEGAKGIVAHFKTGPNCSIFQLEEGSDLINSKATSDVTFSYGHSMDESFGDKVEVTIIATGFEDDSEQKNTASKEGEFKTLTDLNLKKTAGGDFDESIMNYLDHPTFLRNQAD